MRLQRRFRRERAARAEAENISERVTRELYDKQQSLALSETVARAANGASSAEEAIALSLEAVREHGSWPLGHAWMLNAEGGMASTEIWAGDADVFAPFQAASKGLVFAPGEGLPGRVAVERSPLWISGKLELGHLPRFDAMMAAGLQTALCFPLFAGAEVVGVLEFFAARILEPDADLLDLMAQIGTQLGRVVERRQAADALLHQATHDALTGLPNRVFISDELGRALSRQRRRQEEQTAVFFIDLDGFKAVNDTLGHAAGDRVLCQVAHRLGHVIRPHDTLGRLGGDEFVIICEAFIQEHPVVAVAERIADALREPFELDGEQFLVTASVGIALAEGPEGPDEMIEQADAAMYRSKELGRARYEVFSEELRERIAKRLEIERALRHAVERDEFRLHYQPQVDLRTGTLVGVEALLRWERPEGMVMPNDFIPLAEDTGLIVPIGAWVLREALRQSSAWQADPDIGALWTSVNLSVRQLADPDLMSSVTAALAHHNSDPSRLLLEVTESVILEDAEAGLTVLTNLKSLGTDIAIDDFGTGYASLSYLRRFPASVVKVDRSFIAEIDTDDRARSIVSAIIEMARALGLRVVAEGIETPGQLAVARELDFDIGQGYYFARPTLGADLTPLLRQEKPFVDLLTPDPGRLGS